MTTPNSLFPFRSGECGVERIEISTANWAMVSCLNGRKTFFWLQIKTKELTIDSGKTGFKTGNELDLIKLFVGPPSQI